MKKLKIAGYILSGVQLVLSVLVIYMAMSTKFVPFVYGLIGSLILVALVALNVFLATKESKKTRIAGIITSSVLIIILAIASYYLYVTNKAIDDVTGVKTEIEEINVYVAKEDEVSSINEAVEKNYVFGLCLTDDQSHIYETIKEIQSDTGATLQTKDYETIFDLVKGFEAGEIQSFITNAGNLLALDSSEDYKDYSTKVKIIMENTIEEEIEEKQESKIDDDHFCMYFSGIDTFGSVTVKSRSDVNIIGVINNETKQVLLISTPRDYYVELSTSNGKKDKLTHAGIYGIDASMDTLEKLYDVQLSHYVRLNFSGFQDIIDQLGGIDVNSEYAFTSVTAEGTYSFSKGVNHLNGAQALGYARARYAFKDGDRQRGRNQMQLIKATIEKLESSDMLKNYSNVMDQMEGSFQTDMSKDEVGYLVKSTLENGDWEVLTYSVGGDDATKVCYSLGTEAYVMIPNQDDINYANELIDRVLGNEDVTQDEINTYIETKDSEDLIDEESVQLDEELEDSTED